ncbi:MAG: lamin tail domain-containing protein [Bacteroidia bacterium]|nr:lamin tail domain-containing protein [Bacteroidia bacterium]
MKKVILLLLFFPYLSFGQIADDFETGTISSWTEGVVNHWKADSAGCINGNFSLHHIFDNPSSGSDCIGLPLTNLHPAEGTTRWTFRVRHGYDPSASNNWSVFLMSDHGPTDFNGGSAVSGYAAGVNLSGYDDTLRIWKLKKGSVTVVATCLVNWQNDIGTLKAAKLVLERSNAGEWGITVYDNYNKLLGTASGYDPELFNTAWMMLDYRYTSTRDRLLWFDDLRIEGVFYKDSAPPEVSLTRITGTNSLELTFNEDPSDDILNPLLFSLNDGADLPVSVKRKAPALIEVRFKNCFINKTKNHLTIGMLCDRTGNCTAKAEIEFTPVWVETADVVISEIMADPMPAVSLPEKEYLELTNRTEFSFNINNWIMAAGSQKSILPSAEIGPGEFMILCSINDTSLFSKYGKTTGIKSFPSLYDEGKVIWLSDSSGNLIHGVEYSSSWYGVKLKEDGGWSLEMIDTRSPFFTEGNWEASSSKIGGTPGKINSASRTNPDLFFYGIENTFPSDSVTITLDLSETITDLAGQNEKILVDDDIAESVFPTDPLLREFIIKLKKPLSKERESTFFLTGDVHDFSGNEITRRSSWLGIPETASKGEIVFNEILFNPFPEDPDFIEFFNCSEKIVDPSRLYLASINFETGDTSDINAVSAAHRCIMPGSYYVATVDRSRIIARYPGSVPENIFNTTLPSMPDDRGHLLLLNREMEVIDEVIYSEDMHYSLLSGKEGVSLEKIRPEILSAESMNWHSASESSGWGTPGTVNSVFSLAPRSADRIRFSSGRISPDNNGFEDVLVIDLDLEGTGNVVTITIFDEKGGFIRRIVENYLAGEKASIVWDATADDGSLVNSGIYIVFIELYNDKGKIKSWKKVCTVVR